jgi:hypothetical protein
MHWFSGCVGGADTQLGRRAETQLGFGADTQLGCCGDTQLGFGADAQLVYSTQRMQAHCFAA